MQGAGYAGSMPGSYGGGSPYDVDSQYGGSQYGGTAPMHILGHSGSYGGQSSVAMPMTSSYTSSVPMVVPAGTGRHRSSSMSVPYGSQQPYLGHASSMGMGMSGSMMNPPQQQLILAAPRKHHKHHHHHHRSKRSRSTDPGYTYVRY